MDPEAEDVFNQDLREVEEVQVQENVAMAMQAPATEEASAAPKLGHLTISNTNTLVVNSSRSLNLTAVAATEASRAKVEVVTEVEEAIEAVLLAHSSAVSLRVSFLKPDLDRRFNFSLITLD